MIHTNSLTIEWIEKIANDHKGADKILVEKAIRALYLLEQLQKNNLDFIFKGGTSLMLLLPEPKRLSIDLDIIVSNKETDLSSIFGKIIEETDFMEFKEDRRESKSKIDKVHYKFYYDSVTQTKFKQQPILLDILYGESPYSEHIQENAITSSFLRTTEVPVTVRMPTHEALLGDKLTAFAPNTTRVSYGMGKDKEIIKQLYDIENLFEGAKNTEVIREVFNKMAEVELDNRDMKKEKVEGLLEHFANLPLHCYPGQRREGRI